MATASPTPSSVYTNLRAANRLLGELLDVANTEEAMYDFRYKVISAALKDHAYILTRAEIPYEELAAALGNGASLDFTRFLSVVIDYRQDLSSVIRTIESHREEQQ